MFHGIKHSQVTPQSQSRNLFKILVCQYWWNVALKRIFILWILLIYCVCLKSKTLSFTGFFHLVVYDFMKSCYKFSVPQFLGHGITLRSQEVLLQKYLPLKVFFLNAGSWKKPGLLFWSFWNFKETSAIILNCCITDLKSFTAIFTVWIVFRDFLFVFLRISWEWFESWKIENTFKCRWQLNVKLFDNVNQWRTFVKFLSKRSGFL